MWPPRPISLLRRLLLVALLLGLWLPTVPAHAQSPGPSPADVAAARDFFKKGIKASKEKRWQDAVDNLTRSLELKPAPITHYTLAVAQQKVGQLVEALESLRAFLAAPEEQATNAYREPAQEAVALLDKRVGRVRIDVEPADVDDLAVQIDGSPVPLAALASDRLVNPGVHLVKASAPRYLDAKQTFEVEEGGSATVSLVLELAPVPDEPDEPTEPEPGPTQGPDQVESSFPVGPVVLLASGVAVFGAGLAVGMVGLSEAKDAPASEGEEADAARTKGIAGDVIAGVGIAAAVGGIIWLIVYDGSPEPAAEAAAAVRPWQQGPVSGIQLSF
jgi:hypothetical protein